MNYDISIIFGTLLKSGFYNLIRWVGLVVADLIWMTFIMNGRAKTKEF